MSKDSKEYIKSLTLEIAEKYKRRALEFFNLKKYKKALEDLEQIISMVHVNSNIHDGDDEFIIFNAHILRGLVFDELEDYKKSINEFTNAISLIDHSKDKSGWEGDTYKDNASYPLFLRGRAYKNLENYKNAIEDFFDSIKYNQFLKIYKYDEKDSVSFLYTRDTYFQMGLCLFFRKNYQRAIDYLSEAIDLDSDVPIYYSVRSLAYEELGKKDLAQSDNNKFKSMTLNKIDEIINDAHKSSENYKDYLFDFQN